MKRSQLNAIKKFYTYIMDLTGGYMPSELQESLLEHILFYDEDSEEALQAALFKWRETIRINLVRLSDFLAEVSVRRSH